MKKQANYLHIVLLLPMSINLSVFGLKPLYQLYNANTAFQITSMNETHFCIADAEQTAITEHCTGINFHTVN
jgi:hypothetical protein